jgi:hypothetical protein
MKTFEEEVAEAEKRVAEMDRVEGYRERSIGTILAALETGLKHPENGAHYDAFVMLTDLRAETERKR